MLYLYRWTDAGMACFAEDRCSSSSSSGGGKDNNDDDDDDAVDDDDADRRAAGVRSRHATHRYIFSYEVTSTQIIRHVHNG